MENELKSILSSAEDVPDVTHRVSCPCDLMFYALQITKTFRRNLKGNNNRKNPLAQFKSAPGDFS